MERFFRINEKSSHLEECVNWLSNRERAIEIYNEFREKFGIESHEFAPSQKTMYIVPTVTDNEKFDNLLKKQCGNGLREFKKKSEQSKWWVDKLKENGVGSCVKPYVPFWFSGGLGKSTTSLFPIDGVWYVSYKNEFDYGVPEGFEELKASEFYKLCEDDDAKA